MNNVLEAASDLAVATRSHCADMKPLNCGHPALRVGPSAPRGPARGTTGMSRPSTITRHIRTETSNSRGPEDPEQIYSTAVYHGGGLRY